MIISEIAVLVAAVGSVLTAVISAKNHKVGKETNEKIENGGMKNG
jgi:hypothetical protein